MSASKARPAFISWQPVKTTRPNFSPSETKSGWQEKMPGLTHAAPQTLGPLCAPLSVVTSELQKEVDYWSQRRWFTRDF